MIASVLKFDLKPGCVAALEEVFERHQILETAIQVDGCHTLVLMSPEPTSDTAYVFGLWDDDASYQRWMDHPDRGVSTDDLLPLMSGSFDTSAPAEIWQVLRMENK